MILIDTSALYALADQTDAKHSESKSILLRIEADGEDLLVHTYILIETFALLARRHGLAVAVQVSRDASPFQTVTVDRALHDEGVNWLVRHPRGGRSLVDAVSFVIMRRQGIEEAFAFDPDFTRAGFRLSSAR